MYIKPLGNLWYVFIFTLKTELNDMQATDRNKIYKISCQTLPRRCQFIIYLFIVSVIPITLYPTKIR